MYYFFSHSRYKTAFVGVSRARHAHPRQIAPLEMYLCSSRSKANQENRSSTNKVVSLSLSLCLGLNLSLCLSLRLSLCLSMSLSVSLKLSLWACRKSDTPMQER